MWSRIVAGLVVYVLFPLLNNFVRFCAAVCFLCFHFFETFFRVTGADEKEGKVEYHNLEWIILIADSGKKR